MTLHVAIIGGGASGTIMAANLARFRLDPRAVRITIIETSPRLARGLAYATRASEHLLNVRACQMSAFCDDPDDFTRWLNTHGMPECDRKFVPRKLYGAYLEHRLNDASETAGVVRVRQECRDLIENAAGVQLLLGDGSRIHADCAVLATGYGISPGHRGELANPWDGPAVDDKDATIAFVGSGLTMIDNVVSLLAAGHRGKIIVLSRRALIPRAHAPCRAVGGLENEMPLGASVAKFMNWLRNKVSAHEAAGGCWRDVMDGLRPHIRTIWEHMPQHSRSSFLRHAVPFWDVHRHRMPESQSAKFRDAFERGQIELRKGCFLRATRTKGAIALDYMPVGSLAPETIFARYAFDCRGVRRLLASADRGLSAALLERGVARLEAQQLGLDFTTQCALIDGHGKASNRIYGLGPVTLGAFWESIAVPDIRIQAQMIAANLIASELSDDAGSKEYISSHTRRFGR